MKFHEIDPEKDIRYRGPLSYREFRILGWLCIALSQAALILSLAMKAGPEISRSLQSPYLLLTSISRMSLPFLLIANFATILDDSEGYKGQLLKNGIATGAIFLLFLLFYYRYLVGAVNAFIGSRGETLQDMDEILRSFGTSGFLAFNLFIDLLLCTLFMFFLNYRPKRFFTGKKLIGFRLLSILPVMYEVASFVLKLLSFKGLVRIPVFAFPLLTVKPPVAMLVFLVLVLFIKTREYRFRKHGRTHTEYQAFLKTNRNSLQFSVFTAVILVIAAIVDLVIVTLLILLHSGSTSLQEGMAAAQEGIASAQEGLDFTRYLSEINTLGFGQSIVLLPLAPFMLLFSYTRTKQLQALLHYDECPLTILVVHTNSSLA